MTPARSSAVLLGAGLVVAYTGLISGADAITKFIAGVYAAPQLYALSGAIVAVLCLTFGRGKRVVRTSFPQAMALRSAATVLAAIGFFHAFRLLPFAEVFLFIALMPLMAGLMSGPVLGEPVKPTAWAALLCGFIGVLFLFPGGASAIKVGHLAALAAAGFGTVSMVMARYIGQREDNALAQVFFPNLALCLSMSLLLPFVWVPMPLADVAWAGAYALCLFGARWLIVAALRLLPAYAVMPLMNLQFVWMAVLGAVAFGEWPAAGTWIGAAAVAVSGLFLVRDQLSVALGRRLPQSGLVLNPAPEGPVRRAGRAPR